MKTLWSLVSVVAVVNLLAVLLLSGIFTFVVTDSCRNPGGYFCCRNLYNTISKCFSFSGRNCNSDKWKENTISA